jgi:hypothetical protein
MTLNFHKKPQRDFVFHFFKKIYYSLFILFYLLFICFSSARRCACNCVLAYRELRAWLIYIMYMYLLHHLASVIHLLTFAFYSSFLKLLGLFESVKLNHPYSTHILLSKLYLMTLPTDQNYCCYYK